MKKIIYISFIFCLLLNIGNAQSFRTITEQNNFLVIGNGTDSIEVLKTNIKILHDQNYVYIYDNSNSDLTRENNEATNYKIDYSTLYSPVKSSASSLYIYILDTFLDE